MSAKYVIALDKNHNRVHISKAESGGGYICPFCGSEMIARKGSSVEHHFAHKNLADCDPWYSSNKGPWHRHMQSLFRDDLQEVILTVNGVKHIADICLTKPNGQQLVIEFQHSAMSRDEFEERTAFWKANGRDVLWVFDYTHLGINVGFRYLPDIVVADDNYAFQWVHPSKTFGDSVPEGIHLVFYMKPFMNSEWDLQNSTLYRSWQGYFYAKAVVPLWNCHEEEDDQDEPLFFEVRHNDIWSHQLVYEELGDEYHFSTPEYSDFRGISGVDIGKTDNDFMDYMLELTKVRNDVPFRMD